MFKESKYTRWYYSIIESSVNKPKSGPVEKHHIIPKCLGGTDEESNLVRVTPREHMILHLLLPSMIDCKVAKRKMAYALRMMMAISLDTPGRVTAKTYHWRRINNLIRLSTLSEESKKNLSDGLKRHYASDSTAKSRRSKSVSQTMSSKEYIDKISIERTNRYKNPDERKKLSVSVKRAWENNDLLTTHSKTIKAARSTPESRAKTTAQMQNRWANPESKINHAQKMKEYYSNPDNLLKRQAGAKKAWETRRKNAELKNSKTPNTAN